MVDLSTLEGLGFRMDGGNPNQGTLRFNGQHVGNYDGYNGKVRMLENCPTTGMFGGDYVTSVECYVRALEVLTKEKILFTGPDFPKIISMLQGTRAAINGFEDRMQGLAKKLSI